MSYRYAVLSYLHPLETLKGLKAGQVARGMGVGRAALQRHLRTEGESITGLIDEERARRLAVLVRSGDWELESCGKDLGLGSAPAMSRWIRRYYNATWPAVKNYLRGHDVEYYPCDHLETLK